MSSSNAGFSAARSYTSTSGATSPAVSIGSVTSGSSSAVSHERRVQERLSASFQARARGLPRYDEGQRKAGDIFFHLTDGGVGHTNMTAPDITFKVDSVDPGGVRKIEISRDRHPALVYRFYDERAGLAAALLAQDWAGSVKYSDAAGGSGLTFRVFGAVFGSSHFGTGARARLLKYSTRMREAGSSVIGAPKNVICSEMCILAYQLVMSERRAGFIMLDAKHSLPSTLMSYFDGPGSTHWKLMAYKVG